MPEIPFLRARVVADPPTIQEVVLRLETFLTKLREARARSEGREPYPFDELTYAEKKRIRARARKYVDRLYAVAGSRLSREDRAMLGALWPTVEVVPPPSEHQADEIGAALEDEMPWMNAANEALWMALRQSSGSVSEALRLPPLMLVGPPGIGKSFWTRRAGALIGLPTEVLEATTEPAGFGVVGMQRGWSSGGAGRLVRRILSDRIANPLMVIDEIEKSGRVRSDRGTSYDLNGALLPLLEPSSAAAWTCPYFQMPMDMSYVSWILTANSTLGVSAPLLSRCPPIVLPELSLAHLEHFVRREARRRELPDALTEAIIDAMRRTEGWKPSLRTAGRMLDHAEEMAKRGLFH